MLRLKRKTRKGVEFGSREEERLREGEGCLVGIGLSEGEGKRSERVWIWERDRRGLIREVGEVFWVRRRG